MFSATPPRASKEKVFAGREGLAEGEGEGRPLSVAWLEKEATTGQGHSSLRFGVAVLT